MTSLRQGPGSMMTSLIHAAAGNFPYCLLPHPAPQISRIRGFFS